MAPGHQDTTEIAAHSGSEHRGSIRETDVAIIGAGLSGSLAAVVLGRAGYRVTVVDIHAVYPADFRVEKLAGGQLDLLRRLGLFDALAAEATHVNQVWNAAFGRLIDRSVGDHYSIIYPDIVKVVRAQIPPHVDFVVARVADLQAGPERQRVVLSNDEVVEARLVILATGQGDVLRQKLGIKRRVTFPKHTLTFGFTVAPAKGDRFPLPALTYYGEQRDHRIDYLNLLPLGRGMRANLFTFCDHRDEWARAFRTDPEKTLLSVLPGLEAVLGPFRIVDKVQMFMMDLVEVDHHRRDGVVLIGDAFQTSCPAAGTGVSRLLTDVDRLCNVYISRWLATPGMNAAKIEAFYDDPVKQRADADAISSARYRRSLTLETSLGWELHRRVRRLRRRILGWIDGRLNALPRANRV